VSIGFTEQALTLGFVRSVGSRTGEGRRDGRDQYVVTARLVWFGHFFVHDLGDVAVFFDD